MLRDSSTCFRPSMSLALVSACGIPTSEPLWSGLNVNVQCAPQSLATVPLTCRRSLRVQGWCQIARGTRWSHSVWRKRATWESTQSRIPNWAEWKCCCRRGVFWTWAGWCPLCYRLRAGELLDVDQLDLEGGDIALFELAEWVWVGFLHFGWI